jgi:ubiquinone/menaquinone biosynthesis C-methylase UbiE
MTGAAADESTFYRDHWIDIDADRLAASETLYDWPEAFMAMVIGALAAQPGDVVVDLGCGPGFVTRNIARKVGVAGAVHGVELNADFAASARRHAADAGVDGWTTIHHVTDDRIPLPDASVDRVLAKNVLEYVPDAVATLAEIRRVLRPGGLVVAIDSDWGFVIVEPLSADEVRELFDAAAPAFREPHIGRKLRRFMVASGFADVAVDISGGAPDTVGYLRGVLDGMLRYGRTFDRITQARADEFAARLDEAVVTGTYMVQIPQFVVRGVAPG